MAMPHLFSSEINLLIKLHLSQYNEVQHSYASTTYNKKYSNPGVPVNKAVAEAGNYSLNVKDPDNTLQSDQLEIREKNNIFAKINTDSEDMVNLDGSGWVEVPMEQSTRLNPITGQPMDDQQRLYFNKETNSAVEVDGKGTVNLNTPEGSTTDTSFPPPPAPAHPNLIS